MGSAFAVLRVSVYVYFCFDYVTVWGYYFSLVRGLFAEILLWSGGIATGFYSNSFPRGVIEWAGNEGGVYVLRWWLSLDLV